MLFFSMLLFGSDLASHGFLFVDILYIFSPSTFWDEFMEYGFFWLVVFLISGGIGMGCSIAAVLYRQEISELNKQMINLFDLVNLRIKYLEANVHKTAHEK